MGLKLVRGAYLHTERNRRLIHDTKQETDNAFDSAVRFLLDGPTEDQANAMVVDNISSSHQQPQAHDWSAELMLATHNAESIQKAVSLYLKDGPSKDRLTNDEFEKAPGVRSLTFAQLMGTADEVSFKIASQISGAIQEAGSLAERRPTIHSSNPSSLKTSTDTVDEFPLIGVYKYTVWGTFKECLLYMLRRAEENKDSVTRSRGSAVAILRELIRRALFPAAK